MSIFVWMEPMIILNLAYSYEETIIYSFFSFLGLWAEPLPEQILVP